MQGQFLSARGFHIIRSGALLLRTGFGAVQCTDGGLICLFAFAIVVWAAGRKSRIQYALRRSKPEMIVRW